MPGRPPILCIWALASACNLDDVSLGDTGGGASEGGTATEASTPLPATSSVDGSTGTVECPPSQCEDGLVLTLSFGALADSRYLASVHDANVANVRGSLRSCEFAIEDGTKLVGTDLDDCSIIEFEDSIVMSFPGFEAPTVLVDVITEVGKDWFHLASTERRLSYEPVFPNGPECGQGCRRAHTTVTLQPTEASPCRALLYEFSNAAGSARGCRFAQECGQVVDSGSGCGCTDDWVFRNDADPSGVLELVEQARTLGCLWAEMDSDCDCEQADGFACVDDLCQWNEPEVDEE